ncbi:hypothetical protein ACFP3Q_09780 [Nocardioides sp. GCM10027113]|uniref:hypothetical protein n=1 Tax=unclassified Nocardioides TaxID=2615069 RepID=UPI003608B9E5
MARVLGRIVASVAVLCLLVAGQPAVAGGGKPDRVGDVRERAMKVRVDKAGGKSRWVEVTKRTRVILKNTRTGERTRQDVNELARGAKVLGKRVVDGRLARVVLKEMPTGNADCSFDSSEEDGDDVTEDTSFDCSLDYDDGDTATDTDCSYDSSADGPANDWSMDTSWDCSYSEDSEGDADGLDWDCSYSASAGGSEEAGGGDVDADFDFDCSWSGAGTDAPLWDCTFLKGVMGFRCVSAELDQQFEYVLDSETMRFDGGFDFQSDLVDEDTDDNGAGCAGNAADGYECSFDGEAGQGDCGLDWDFDSSRGSREGDVSGSMSYSCSWDS